jgi:hypothetical protein
MSERRVKERRKHREFTRLLNGQREYCVLSKSVALFYDVAADRRTADSDRRKGRAGGNAAGKAMTDGQRVLYQEAATFTDELAKEIRSHQYAPRSLHTFAHARCALILGLIDDILQLDSAAPLVKGEKDK